MKLHVAQCRGKRKQGIGTARAAARVPAWVLEAASEAAARVTRVAGVTKINLVRLATECLKY